MSPRAKKKQNLLKITQIRSQIGYQQKQRRVLAGLGLGRIGRHVTRLDDPCIRGMINKVPHLVKVEEVEG
jgi:large subunit ribosomal protein L30